MIEKLDVYKRLKQLNILGEERRLEWADAITRIRTQRELLDLSLPRRPPAAARLGAGQAGATSSSSPAPCACSSRCCTRRTCCASSPTCAIRATPTTRCSSCSLTRIGQPPTGVQISPRLRGECDIDLITIIDRAAKG